MKREVFEEMLKEEPFNRDVFKYYKEEHTPEIKGLIALRNEKLIHFVINKFFGYKDKDEDVYKDYYQEGFIGLMKAVDKYDYEKGNQFSTYAIFWIRNGINNFIRCKEGAISLPSSYHSKRIKIHRAEKALRAKGLDVNTPALVKESGLPEEDILKVKALFAPVISLSEKKAGDDGHEKDELINFIPANDDTSEEAMKLYEKEQLRKVIDAKLNALEKNIITLRFGMDGSGTRTLAAISKEMGFTRQYINIVEKNAITKLRACVDRDQFSTIMGD